MAKVGDSLQAYSALLGDTGHDGTEAATILAARSACPPKNAGALISGSLARPYPTLADRQADLADGVGVGGENRSSSVSSALLSCGRVGVLDLPRWRGSWDATFGPVLT